MCERPVLVLLGALVACSSPGPRPAPDAGPVDTGGAPDAPRDAASPVPVCPYVGPPVLDVNLFPPCPGCTGGHCVPRILIDDPEAEAELTPCDAENFCVPDLFIETGGEFIPASCTSVGGGEGRCLSRCIPSVEEQADLLPQATCATTELCAPCYNPFDGTSTGACEQSCDPGPTRPAVTFGECCGGDGYCVPTEAVPPDQRESLGADTCTDPDRLCVPKAFIDEAGPEVCHDLWGSEGRCIPACVPQVQSLGIIFADCENGMKCVTCEVPLVGDTGVCDP